MRKLRLASFGAALMLVSGCTHDLELAPRLPRAAATTTTGPWASMIFVARTDSGVLAIDLGWTGADDALARALREIGAAPADVRWVFLTHAHRDHIGGWPTVRTATFVLGQAEVPYFTGSARYAGFIPRIGDRMFAYHRPHEGELTVLPVRDDTVFALGRDTVRAYSVPGHTAGSVAYLFRETLFAGDAANWRVTSGFRGARSEFSDDVEQSRESMRRLVARLDSSETPWRVLCTAHGKCGLADSTLRLKILR
ncbi:MAG: MBL fold metallo-hydrolase [Gemmatimonadaceae bacterium]